jgi:hypothetical protein
MQKMTSLLKRGKQAMLTGWKFVESKWPWPWIVIAVALLILAGAAFAYNHPINHPAPLPSPTAPPVVIQPLKLPTAQPTPQPTVAPILDPTETNNLWDPTYDADYDWGCVPKQGYLCITGNTPSDMAIANVIYMEGGGLEPVLIATHLQLLQNRMVYVWTCSTNPDCHQQPDWVSLNPAGLPYDSLTRSDRIRLAEYVMSQAYGTASGANFPVWNSWASPFPMDVVNQNPALLDLYDRILLAVDVWMDHPDRIVVGYGGAQYTPPSVLKNPAVMFTYVTMNEPNAYLDQYHTLRLVLHHLDQTYYVYFMTFPYFQ